jgi:hypothetical protein
MSKRTGFFFFSFFLISATNNYGNYFYQGFFFFFFFFFFLSSRSCGPVVPSDRSSGTASPMKDVQSSIPTSGVCLLLSKKKKKKDLFFLGNSRKEGRIKNT